MIRAYSLILPTFFVAFILAVFPMPRLLDYVRPEWVAMTLIFWVLMSPAKAGVFLGFFMGILLDVLHGHLLGLNAFAMSALAYLCILLQPRMRLYNQIQQSLLVFVLVGLFLLVRYWLESLMLGQGRTALLWPSVGSAVLWPFAYGILGSLRHYFRT